MDKWSKITDKLDLLEQQHLYRRMKPIDSAQRSHVRMNGKDYLMMASNSYLDWCAHPEVIRYAEAVLKEFGTGSGGSRLTTGDTCHHERLEQKLAEFKGTESALLFNSGYVANVAILQALCGPGDVIFSDELNHASIIDGCRMSRAEVVVYKHNDMKDLEEKARQKQGKFGVIVSDGVFSMDGDIVHLPELMEIADRYDFLSMVDEAHSTGVMGESGRGLTEYFGLKQNPDILMGTLSKALGSEGGFVCGRKELIEYLKHLGRGFVFSTSMSPVSAAASYKAVELLASDPSPVRKLQENIRIFTESLCERGIEVHSETAIIPIQIGDEGKAMEVSNRLFEQGYFISAIRYPTVARGTARLRVALMASHTKEELEEAARVIAETVRQVKAE